MIRKVHRLEVKRAFLLADAAKELFTKPLSLQQLDNEYKRMQIKIYLQPEEELDSQIREGNTSNRLEKYDSVDWYFSNSSLFQMGVWPQMRKMDLRLTSGDVMETAQKIQAYQKKKLNLDYSDETERERRQAALEEFLKKAESIRLNISFLYERFPIILLPGGENREKFYNKIARENSQPTCPILKFDIDDGNSRAVSYAMQGIKQAPSYHP